MARDVPPEPADSDDPRLEPQIEGRENPYTGSTVATHTETQDGSVVFYNPSLSMRAWIQQLEPLEMDRWR